jgi:hypothetical protein
VMVKSHEIIKAQKVNLQPTVSFFPENYVIYPGEELMVPIADLQVLARTVDPNYVNQKYKASLHSVETCNINPDEPIESRSNEIIETRYCESLELGFAISTVFIDIFGDEYRHNEVASLGKEIWRKPYRTE